MWKDSVVIAGFDNGVFTDDSKTNDGAESGVHSSRTASPVCGSACRFNARGVV